VVRLTVKSLLNHLDLEKFGNFVDAKIKEAILAATDG
jgi:hypothetical protein